MNKQTTNNFELLKIKNKEEIKEWLLNNCLTKKGDLDLSGLDFSDFNGYVDISEMKVKGDLYQSYQKVEGDLFQGNQEVKSDLIQNNQKVQGDLIQSDQKVGRDLTQDKIINGKTKEQALREVEKLYE